jgi:hypothetical protein
VIRGATIQVAYRGALAVILAFTVSLTTAKGSLCQAPTKARSLKPPSLGLKILLAKTILGLHEKLSASCELTNLTDQMLCFPPTSACSFSMSAELLDSDGAGVGAGMGGGCGSSDSAPYDLLPDVEQHWVKLPPNQTHVTQCLSGIEFPNPGSWKVHSQYHRLKVGSGQKSLLQSVGCKAVEMDVTSDPVEIMVVDVPPR